MSDSVAGRTKKMRASNFLFFIFLSLALSLGSAKAGSPDPSEAAREEIFSVYDDFRELSHIDEIMQYVTPASRVVVQDLYDNTEGDITAIPAFLSNLKGLLCANRFGESGLLPPLNDIIKVIVIDREWAEITVCINNDEEIKIYMENEGDYYSMDWRFVVDE